MYTGGHSDDTLPCRTSVCMSICLNMCVMTFWPVWPASVRRCITEGTQPVLVRVSNGSHIFITSIPQLSWLIYSCGYRPNNHRCEESSRLWYLTFSCKDFLHCRINTNFKKSTTRWTFIATYPRIDPSSSFTLKLYNQEGALHVWNLRISVDRHVVAISKLLSIITRMNMASQKLYIPSNFIAI